MVVDDNNSNFLNRPVTLNSKNNLLEIEEHMYILDDVEKPIRIPKYVSLFRGSEDPV